MRIQLQNHSSFHFMSKYHIIFTEGAWLLLFKPRIFLNVSVLISTRIPSTSSTISSYDSHITEISDYPCIFPVESCESCTIWLNPNPCRFAKSISNIYRFKIWISASLFNQIRENAINCRNGSDCIRYSQREGKGRIDWMINKIFHDGAANSSIMCWWRFERILPQHKTILGWKKELVIYYIFFRREYSQSSQSGSIFIAKLLLIPMLRGKYLIIFVLRGGWIADWLIDWLIWFMYLPH